MLFHILLASYQNQTALHTVVANILNLLVLIIRVNASVVILLSSKIAIV